MEFYPKSTLFLPIFWKNMPDPFLGGGAILTDFLFPFRKYVYLNYFSTKQLDFFEKI